MDTSGLERVGDCEFRLPKRGAMRVPVVFIATAEQGRHMDEKVVEQASNVASLPGVVDATYVMPDGHWGYGFPIGGVAAFDADEGVVSAGGVGFDVSCGVRCLVTGLSREQVEASKSSLAEELFRRIPAGVGSHGRIRLDARGLDEMLDGGARWAVERGWGRPDDLERIEERGRMRGADPAQVSSRARERQRDEMGSLGSGNHYLEVQRVAALVRPELAEALGLAVDDVVVSIHCGSRGLGHQIGTDYLRSMAIAAPSHGIALPDRELACAPIRSTLGVAYLGAMRAAINCALANRQILTDLTRTAFAAIFPGCDLRVLYDVSHNTCKEEEHEVDGRLRRLFVHRKGATRAFAPGHPELPASLRDVGQPVLIGGTMGTESWVLVGGGDEAGGARAFASACHGAGRRMSRHAAIKQWRGRALVDHLQAEGILVRSPSMRGVAEEAPGAYKDVAEVVEAAERSGLARRVARLVPMICVKG